MMHILSLLFIVVCVIEPLFSYQFSREQVLRPFSEGRAFKVIAGLHNFDANNVKKVASAAEHGGATHIDIACDGGLVNMVKSMCFHTAVCVSSIKPKDFVKAVEAGADMVEIGNFDGFYESGLRFSAKSIVDLTKETRALLGPQIPLSVTVPHTLSLPDQIALAIELERLGADIIQTEGKMRVDPSSMGVQQLIETAAPSLASAFALSRAVKIPVLCSSGLTDVTAPMALAAGAKGVGVGSVINRLREEQEMLLAVSAISEAIRPSRGDQVIPDMGFRLGASSSSPSASRERNHATREHTAVDEQEERSSSSSLSYL